MGNRFYDGQPGPEIRRSLNELEAVFDDAILNAKGPQGWAPVLAGAIDGARRVHQVVDWVGGEGDKPTTLGYVGVGGIVADIASAIDVRGPHGATGADGINGTNGAEGPEGPQGPAGGDGANGSNGWTAVLANVTDSARIVQQVVDWVGGEGAKPATGKYVGPTGLVDTAGAAVNVRGPAGSGSGDVAGPVSSTNNHVALFDGATGKVIKDGGVLGTAAAQSVEYFASAAEGALALTSLQPDDVAAVATSGAYADLSGRPTIPAAQQQTDWNAATGITAIANKPAVIAAGASQTAARTAIGAGTSNLVIGTTAGTALAGNTAVLPDAPEDGKTYGRKNKAWVEAAGGGAVRMVQQVLTSGTSWTAPANLVGGRAHARAVGGGSGGAATNAAAPLGGTPGGYAEGIFDVTPSTSYPLQIGAGGVSITAASNTPGGAGGSTTIFGMAAGGGPAHTSVSARLHAGGSASGGLINLSPFLCQGGNANPWFLVGSTPFGVPGMRYGTEDVLSTGYGVGGVGGTTSGVPSQAGLPGVIILEYLVSI